MKTKRTKGADLQQKMDEIWRLRFEEGYTLQEIADELNCSRNGVHYLLGKTGPILAIRKPLMIDEIERLREDCTMQEVAKKLGLSVNTIRKWTGGHRPKIRKVDGNLEIKCYICGEWEIHTGKAKKRSTRLCRRCNARRTREYNQKRRTLARAALGGVCVWCGFDDWRALQIDHIHGQTGKKREPWTTAVSRILAGDTDPYQLLCANCNTIKKYENNEFPPRKYE